MSRLLNILLLAVALSPVVSMAGERQPITRDDLDQAYADVSQEVRDAYIVGRLMTAYALSEHLSPFDLTVRAEDGAIRLTGNVQNAVQRDLAVEIARGIPQVKTVESRIAVVPEDRTTTEASGDSFSNRFRDANITARVKTRLLWNENTEGLGINVDTDKRTVRLSGEVGTSAEAALAVTIAKNTGGVKNVIDSLEIRQPSG